MTISLKPHWAKRLLALASEQAQLQHNLERSKQEAQALLQGLCADNDIPADLASKCTLEMKGDVLHLHVPDPET